MKESGQLQQLFGLGPRTRTEQKAHNRSGKTKQPLAGFCQLRRLRDYKAKPAESEAKQKKEPRDIGWCAAA